MMLYIFYKIGCWVSTRLPLALSYRMACGLADIHYNMSHKDREAVINNLKVVLGGAYDEARLAATAREVFRNFAKYLVDFFRFSKIGPNYIKENVKMEGLENIDTALSKGKGVIVLSAHIGNWELGGAALSLSGYPIAAVTLTHQNKKINDFFTRQRMLGGVRPIEIGLSLRSCYSVLKNNGLLALLGDRDFSKNGIRIEFFGQSALIPKGPAALSYRMGSAIVPTFLIRDPDDSFKLIMEEPIFPNPGEPEEEAIVNLTRRYLAAIESCIRRYPAEWCVFREIWGEDAESMRPDTII